MQVHKRKIQNFSKYSYSVTLPVHWVKMHNFQRANGDKSKKEAIVNIFENPDGSLAIYPSQKEKKRKQKKIYRIEFDDILKKNPKFIEEKGISLMLISYYMNGAEEVRIISKKPIPDIFIDQIERIQNRLLFNWNMIKISSRNISIKNISYENPENIFQENIPQYLRECFAILLWMLDDIRKALKTGEYKPLKKIEKRDTKIDRYYFFIVRQIRTIFENPQFSKPLNYTHKKLVDLRLLASKIENVGDSLKNIAKILIEMNEFFEETKLKIFLSDYFDKLHEAYSLLSDYLRKIVLLHEPKIGLNKEILSLIARFRLDGIELKSQWLQIAKKLDLIESKHTFLEYYKGIRLIGNLEDIYDHIFDFTNIFF